MVKTRDRIRFEELGRRDVFLVFQFFLIFVRLRLGRSSGSGSGFSGSGVSGSGRGVGSVGGPWASF